MADTNKNKQEKESYDVKKARQIVLDTIGEEEKAEEKINIKVVPGGFEEKDVSKIDSNWNDKKEKTKKIPKKEFISISPEPTQKFIDEKSSEAKIEESGPTKEDIEYKKVQLQKEMMEIEEKPIETAPDEVSVRDNQPSAVGSGAVNGKKEKLPLVKKSAVKTAKEAPRKKIKSKKTPLEIPVKLEIRKKTIKKKSANLNLRDFFGKIRIINSIYIISYTFIVGIIFYLMFAMAIYNFNPDNAVVRKISSVLPVPALISNIGMIEYYDYQDYLKFYNYDFDKTKTVLVWQIVYKKTVMKNPSFEAEQLYEEIKKEMGKVKLWSLVD